MQNLQIGNLGTLLGTFCRSPYTLATYLPTYLPFYQSTYPPPYLPTYLPTYTYLSFFSFSTYYLPMNYSSTNLSFAILFICNHHRLSSYIKVSSYQVLLRVCLMMCCAHLFSLQ